MNEKETLTMQIQSVAFAMLDLRMYLDTHPDDLTAMALLNKYKIRYAALVAEYERTYGPYNTNLDDSSNRWQWVRDPWPWEYGAIRED